MTAAPTEIAISGGPAVVGGAFCLSLLDVQDQNTEDEMPNVSVRQTTENGIVTKVEIANLTMAVTFSDDDDRPFPPEAFEIGELAWLPVGYERECDLGRWLAQLLELRLGKGIKGFSHPVYINLTVERLPNP